MLMKLRLAFALLAALLAAARAVAAGYPDKPIRLIIPFPPGGNIDITARAIAPGLTEALGQQIVIDNRGGAGGVIGIDLTSKAAPDGYTMALGSPGALTIAPSLYSKLPYNPVTQLAPSGLVSNVPQVLVVSPALQAQSVKDLIALARSRPGALKMASAGNGTTNHLVGELFQLVTGTRLTHVPYKGSGPAMIDLISGQVDLHFDQTTSSMSFIRSGKVRALAVTTKKRSSMLPDVPTLDEAGVPGFDASTYSGLVFPAGTPREVVAKMNAAINKTLAQKSVRDQFAGFGGETYESTPEQFAQLIRDDVARWGKVIKETGIKLD
jgi:tripartite-type tricarboxylate transporter receptor subunit TctC